MATLEHNLNTIELGSTNWRNIINQNFVNLDINRFFVVELDANLPSTFKGNRFFYSKESNKISYDNNIELVEIGGGSGGTTIDFLNNPNKFLKVNAAGDNLEYVTLNPISNGGGGEATLSILSNVSASNYCTAAGYVSKIGVSSSYVSNFGYNNDVKIGSNFSSVFGSANTLNNGSNYSNVLGYQNILNSYNTVIGYQNSIHANYNKIFGNMNDIMTTYNTIFGSGISNFSYSNVTIFGDSYNPQNSHSFIKKINNSININTKIRKTNLNTNSLTNVYIKESTSESLYVFHNSLINLKAKINFFNSSNQTCKVLNVDLIVTCNGTGSLTLKKLNKTTIFEDSEYALADINFNLTTSNKIILQVNTNNVNTTFVADYDIEFIS